MGALVGAISIGSVGSVRSLDLTPCGGAAPASPAAPANREELNRFFPFFYPSFSYLYSPPWVPWGHPAHSAGRTE